jgi:hypothetical protein
VACAGLGAGAELAAELAAAVWIEAGAAEGAGAEASSLGFGVAVTGRAAAAAVDCCTTPVIDAGWGSGLLSGAATAVTGRIGSMTSGAD